MIVRSRSRGAAGCRYPVAQLDANRFEKLRAPGPVRPVAANSSGLLKRPFRVAAVFQNLNIAVILYPVSQVFQPHGRRDPLQPSRCTRVDQYAFSGIIGVLVSLGILPRIR